MSGIAGIFHFDQKPVDALLLQRMLDCIPHRGSDAVRHWIDGYIGLGHRQFCTTEESLCEVQPAKNQSGTCWVTFDGRIDNREELIDRLEHRVDERKPLTDVELLLHSYDVWGVDCLKWVIGDFAFGLWDSRKRHLFCARDTYGIRPFYYHYDGRAFSFGSECMQLFQIPSVPKSLNEEKIAEWFTPSGLHYDLYRDLEKTYFKNITELPFGHYLLINKSDLQVHRYWDVDPAKEIRYRNERDYTEHFLDLFRTAVRSRLRSSGPIGSELSGGFDSSSILGVAQELFRSGELNSQTISAFSIVFDELSCDERPAIKLVLDKYPTKYRFVKADKLCGLDNFPPGSESPWLTNGPYQLHTQKAMNSLYESAYEEGVRVMLSGEGAESHVLGNSLVLDSLIRNVHWGELFKSLKVKLSRGSWLSTMNYLLRYGFVPLLPPSINDHFYCRWVRGRLQNPIVPDWITPKFKETFLSEINKQNERRSSLPKHKTWGRQVQYESLNPSNPVLDRPLRRPVERRFPYHDRRLIEFCFAIPPEQKYQHLGTDQNGGVRGRILQRQAFVDVLPEAILRTQVKVNFNDVYVKRFKEFKQAYTNIFAPPARPVISQNGYVDQEKFWIVLTEALRRVENFEELNAYETLWINRITQLEIWLQTFRRMAESRNFSSARTFDLHDMNDEVVGAK